MPSPGPWSSLGTFSPAFLLPPRLPAAALPQQPALYPYGTYPYGIFHMMLLTSRQFHSKPLAYLQGDVRGKFLPSQNLGTYRGWKPIYALPRMLHILP